MQYEYQGVEIALSIYILQKYSIDNEIDQRKPYHRTSFPLDTVGDCTRPYQIMQVIGNSPEFAMILEVSVSYAI